MTLFTDTSKRRFPRRGYRRRIGVLYNGDYFLARGVEIGEGGISLRSDRKEITEGGLVVLTFRGPDGEFISVRSEIKTATVKGMTALYGCAFVNLNFETRRDIRTFVSARSEKEK